MAVVAALAVAVSVVGQVLDPDDKVNRADLVALVVAALAFAAPVVLWARRRATPAPPASEETITAGKTTLTNLVAEQWRTEATIRSLGDPEPIPVSWHLTDDPGLMDHPRLIGHQPLTFTATGDRIPRLAENFRALRRRRLVITGGPGSGKTTLAVQLLLHLADDHRPEEPVPVLFTIAGWDTTAQPRLHDWLAARLAQDYPALTNPAYGPDAARTLVGRGHILPILDGLDELPGDARASAIAALNGSLAERDQFILTSRTGELAAALDQAGDVLTAAAVIAPRPLTPQAAAGYVRTCLPPRPRHDWTPVIEALENADRPGLAEVASTALGLWLIRTVYITPSTDPAPLVGPLADDRGRLRAHLLDHLIPAAIQARPPTRDPAEHFRPRHAWDPDQTRHYLAYLARQLTAHDTRDLAWWHLADLTTTPAQQRRFARMFGLVGGLAVGLAVASLRGLVTGLREGLGAGFEDGIVLGPVIGYMLGLGFGHAAQHWVHGIPGYADLRLQGRTTSLIKRIAKNLPAALLFGLMGWVVFGLVGWLAFALVFTLLFGLLEWAEQPASTTIAITPQSMWKADRTLTLLRTPTFWLVGGMLIGPLFGPVAALGGGLVFGLVSGKHYAWLGGGITVQRLARAGHVPRNLMAFLDDAHRLGLLRTVGPVYQFRHADLHDHLAALHTEAPESGR
ncbi:NACHT domain-containing protein [Microbispora triticiradicis]|uniref:NACHT domain-containing protein n=1 Tax=Microbispora triticiradicis TaxID=2200763 RepID=A0ABX9LS09_9ACTN|nr:NACHT domain-containing protein [Microbispora triticiradicis]RGA06328.1 NACHT domain-containing protein [Microbispora triticiradicis]